MCNFFDSEHFKSKCFNLIQVSIYLTSSAHEVAQTPQDIGQLTNGNVADTWMDVNHVILSGLCAAAHCMLRQTLD